VYLIPRTFLTAVILVLSSGSAVFADPADQAATPAPTPSCVVPPAGIIIDVSNPNPGASLNAGGNVVITGTAYDQAATSGSGISSVTAYLGSRDAGGIYLGTATLGQSTGGAGPAASGGFTLRSSTLPVGSGSRSIFVYAQSAISGNTASVEVPVYLGPVPTAVKGQVPTAVLPTPPACTPTPTPAPTTAPTSTPLPAPVVATPAATTAPVVRAAPTVAPTIALPTLAPLPTPAPVATPAASQPAAAPTPGSAVAPATATTAPRGGGIPGELGLPLLAIGAIVFGGGYALRHKRM
jgi:hypothetical protein